VAAVVGRVPNHDANLLTVENFNDVCLGLNPIHKLEKKKDRETVVPLEGRLQLSRPQCMTYN